MKRCPILMLALLAACMAGCKTIGRTSPDADRPAAIRSPALLEYCGVPWHEAFVEYRHAKDEKRLPGIKKPVAWACPLHTENLSRVLPQADCIRIFRINPKCAYDITLESVVVTDDKKIVLLTNSKTVVEFLNNNRRFFPETQADAEYILFAFAELCGYQLLTGPPEIPSPDDHEKRLEAAKLDWSISWRPCDNGWIVSCVFVTDHGAIGSYRYTIFIRVDGNVKVLKAECVFGMEYI
jgi:hypothetical protein